MLKRVIDSTLESFSEVLVSRAPDAFPGFTWHEICNLLKGAMLDSATYFVATDNAIGLFTKFNRRFDKLLDIDEVFCLGRNGIADKAEIGEIYKACANWGSKFGAKKIYVDNCSDFKKEDFKELFPKSSQDLMPFIRIL